jgi:hypothetical protein
MMMMIIATATGASSTRMSTGARRKAAYAAAPPRHCVQPVEIIGERCGTVLVLSLITNSAAAAAPQDSSSTAQVAAPAAQATSGVPRLVRFGFDPRLPLIFLHSRIPGTSGLSRPTGPGSQSPKHLESHRFWVYTHQRALPDTVAASIGFR